MAIYAMMLVNVLRRLLPTRMTTGTGMSSARLTGIITYQRFTDTADSSRGRHGECAQTIILL